MKQTTTVQAQRTADAARVTVDLAELDRRVVEVAGNSNREVMVGLITYPEIEFTEREYYIGVHPYPGVTAATMEDAINKLKGVQAHAERKHTGESAKQG